jgi:hypothetical protein
LITYLNASRIRTYMDDTVAFAKDTVETLSVAKFTPGNQRKGRCGFAKRALSAPIQDATGGCDPARDDPAWTRPSRIFRQDAVAGSR